MRNLGLMAFALMVAAAAPAGAQSYKSYTNVRFAYAVCYPPFMTPQPEAPNGDGRVFGASDGGKLTVFGRNNPDGASLADTVRDDAADLLGRTGTVTYRAQKNNWAVFSGTTGSKLVYSKTFQRGDQFAIFELTYPHAAANRYKLVSEQLSRCFRLTAPNTYR